MIELRGLGYSYGREALLSEGDLSLSPGSFQFLTGPSGAGKTTLLKICYLELTPTLGAAEVFGTDAAMIDRDGVATARQRMGVVQQDCPFLDHLSISENITLPLRVTGKEVAEGDLSDLLGWVGLKSRADAKPPELSGGERQRAALARAVVADPDAIWADVPTGNIDWDMSLRLLTLLTELNRMGKAILFATHDLALIRAAKAQVSARVLRIRDGRLVAAGADL